MESLAFAAQCALLSADENAALYACQVHALLAGATPQPPPPGASCDDRVIVARLDDVRLVGRPAKHAARLAVEHREPVCAQLLGSSCLPQLVLLAIIILLFARAYRWHPAQVHRGPMTRAAALKIMAATGRSPLHH